MQWPEVALGQVEAAHPAEYAVSVVFPNLGMLTGIRVPVAAAQASRQHGQFALPQRGDWGIVVFYQNDPRSARWLCTLTDAFWHAAPLELLTDDPDLQARFERSGRDTYRHGNGDLEVQHPDGSLFRLTHGSGDPQKRTRRKIGITEGAARTPKRVDPDAPEADPLQLYFEQKNGVKVHLDERGTLKITLEGAYTVEATREKQVAVSNGAGASVRLLPSGDVAISPGAGGKLLLGGPGDMRPVARQGDMTQFGGPIITAASNTLAS
ncbi:hypothetical protein Dgeo_3033 (plasmid) [Deinococcus geothermalis DSM 11300]|uniref:Gp5/Type VI secretion system Vgr protein OB-fold domain-containing protein n=1 Tax=Deinococcus geothermalis (strain DSM 11300 / CIP 105573 / AG-3a) TaxID=319795 RepID=A8ZRG5_DEIGD|nr:hypothetical protein [Deinococcus geothermalis]ABW35074.1 hypothetical protein Dgeo_3033 [Deinococcus geothermalis DSM 11300]